MHSFLGYERGNNIGYCSDALVEIAGFWMTFLPKDDQNVGNRGGPSFLLAEFRSGHPETL